MSNYKNQSTSSIAKQVQPGINVEVAFPTGDFGKVYSIGFGGSVMGRYALSDKANLTASLGYIRFSGKTVTETFLDDEEQPITESYKVSATHAVPLRLGANYLIGSPFLSREK